jgi:hypothetical protein
VALKRQIQQGEAGCRQSAACTNRAD